MLLKKNVLIYTEWWSPTISWRLSVAARLMTKSSIYVPYGVLLKNVQVVVRRSNVSLATLLRIARKPWDICICLRVFATDHKINLHIIDRSIQSVNMRNRCQPVYWGLKVVCHTKFLYFRSLVFLIWSMLSLSKKRLKTRFTTYMYSTS